MIAEAWEKDYQRNPYEKCRICGQLFGFSAENKDDYHDKILLFKILL